MSPKYSANCRIAEYRIVPTISANLSLLFRQNIWLKYSAEYYAETAFGRSLTIRESNYLVLCVSVLLLEPVVPLHVHELRLPPEELVLLVHQVEQLHYQVLSLPFRKHAVYARGLPYMTSVR